jgi:hypothetical protein
VWVTIDITRLPIAALPAIVMFTRAVVWLVTWKVLIRMPADCGSPKVDDGGAGRGIEVRIRLH